MSEFGFKELYSVVLKTTYPIEVDGKTIEAGEVVASFDKIQIANFNEIKTFISAHGGFQDTPRVIWEDTKELKFNLLQGIFSKMQFALMSNAKLLTPKTVSPILISKRDAVESDENGKIVLEKIPTGKVFIYDQQGNKVVSVLDTELSKIRLKPYTEYVVDYTYAYSNGYSAVIVGQRLINGFLTLEGKTRVKDDITGQTKTGIIYIPKLKLMSDLSIQLGENAMPVVGRLDAVALPSGNRGSSRVMEFVVLNNDIDSDM